MWQTQLGLRPLLLLLRFPSKMASATAINSMTATVRLVWSDKATSVLLEALRDRQSLWNTKSESYKNRNIKKKDYQEVVEIIKEDLPAMDLASVKGR